MNVEFEIHFFNSGPKCFHNEARKTFIRHSIFLSYLNCINFLTPYIFITKAKSFEIPQSMKCFGNFRWLLLSHKYKQFFLQLFLPRMDEKIACQIRGSLSNYDEFCSCRWIV